MKKLEKVSEEKRNKVWKKERKQKVKKLGERRVKKIKEQWCMEEISEYSLYERRMEN